MSVIEECARAMALNWYLRKHGNQSDAEDYANNHFGIWVEEAKSVLTTLAGKLDETAYFKAVSAADEVTCNNYRVLLECYLNQLINEEKE